MGLWCINDWLLIQNEVKESSHKNDEYLGQVKQATQNITIKRASSWRLYIRLENMAYIHDGLDKQSKLQQLMHLLIIMWFISCRQVCLYYSPV